MKVGERVRNEQGVEGAVVQRIDALFVDVEWDEPVPIKHLVTGETIMVRSTCTHVATLAPAGGLW